MWCKDYNYKKNTTYQLWILSKFDKYIPDPCPFPNQTVFPTNPLRKDLKANLMHSLSSDNYAHLLIFSPSGKCAFKNAFYVIKREN